LALPAPVLIASRRGRRATPRPDPAQPGPVLRAVRGAAPAQALAATGAAVLLAVEILVSLAQWLALPLAWTWVGRQVGAATGSLSAAAGAALIGFTANVVLAMMGLARLDGVWLALRRAAGHDQREGALTRVVVGTATVGLALFFLWYYVLSDGAYVIPFMPYR
jgi:hypothetical protein